jgi:transglutaminase-like putative cysteine protease
MFYDIRLRITYDYARPAAEGRQLLRLVPRDVPGVQRVLSARLDIHPDPAERTSFRDFFGNLVTEVAMTGGHSKTRFEAVAQIERLQVPQPADLSPPLAGLGAEIAALRGLGPTLPQHFRGPSPRIGPEAAITAFAVEVTRDAATTLGAVEALGLALNDVMTFDADATTVDTPPAEAFALRTGVCQDFAQVMIAGLRGIGVPAGYVSGFLRTVPPPGKARLEGADAMHAWVMAWCGRGVGWVDYDPTNACFVTDQHITIGHGRDYGDVSPVAGILRIAGGQTSHQAVDVIARG